MPPPVKGRNLVIAWCVVWQPALNVKIIKVYIPAWPDTYDVARSFPDRYESSLAVLKKLDMANQDAGDLIQKWVDAPFNGTVFMYHETVIAPEQLGDLVRFYRSKRLTLSFRDDSYLDRIIKRSSQ
jgi:hypothetical protein